MKNKFFYVKKISIIFILKLIFTQTSIADVIKDFKVEGNNRVSNQTVIMFSNLNIGDDANNDILNEALKNLYYTDYFKEISISFDSGLLNIKVEENPIIQSVTINGIKSSRINEKIKEVTLKIEKYPFVENKINDQVLLIKNILKSNGYYFVDIKTGSDLYPGTSDCPVKTIQTGLDKLESWKLLLHESGARKIGLRIISPTKLENKTQ